MKTIKPRLARNYLHLFNEATITLSSGSKVHYLRTVSTAHTDSRTYVVIHGMTGTNYSMLTMAGRWAEAGHTVYVLDLPGHGKSDKISISSFDDITLWLKLSLETLGVTDGYILVGNSFGSSVCLAFVQEYGLPAKSVMLLGCPVVELDPVMTKLESMSVWLPNWLISWVYYRNIFISDIRMYMLLVRWRSNLYRSVVKDDLSVEARQADHNYCFRHLMPAMYRARPFSGLLEPSIALRTRVVYGRNDKIAGLKAKQAVNKLFPPESVVEAAQCGHLVQIEALQEIDDAIDSLIDLV